MKVRGVKSHGMDGDHLPDKQWLVTMLSTLKPSDEIFSKDYVPPPKKNALEEYKTMHLPKEFLNGLPDSKSKAKRRRLKVVGEALAK